MPLIGYARVSSSGQSLEVQRDQLLAAGCTRVFEEKRSGLSQDGREQLALALDYVRDGDVLIVTRLDRLARSITDLRQIVDRLTAKEVGFRALQQGDLDTSTSNGRLMLNMLGHSLSLRLTYAVSAKGRASIRPKPTASIRAGSLASLLMRSAS